jgi:hypothetical protein
MLTRISMLTFVIIAIILVFVLITVCYYKYSLASYMVYTALLIDYFMMVIKGFSYYGEDEDYYFNKIQKYDKMAREYREAIELLAKQLNSLNKK